MSRDYIPVWSLFAVFYLVPVAITYAVPPGPGVGDALDEALFFVQVAAMVFVVASLGLYVAMRLAGRGPVVRLADFELGGRFLAIGFAWLSVWIAVQLVRDYGGVGLVYAAALLVYAAYAAKRSSRRQKFIVKKKFTTTPEAVFDFVADIRNWPRYLPGIESVEPAGKALRMGSVVALRSRFGKRLLEREEVVIAFEPPRRFGTAVAGRAVTDMYELEEVTGGAQVSYTYSGESTIARGLLGDAVRILVIGSRAREDGEARLEAIAKLVEGASPAPV